MNSHSPIYTYRLTHRVRTGGSGFAAIAFILIGLLCLIFVHWLLGLLFIVGRGLYARGYVENPEHRELGFGLGLVATAILLLGGLLGAMRSAF